MRAALGLACAAALLGGCTMIATAASSAGTAPADAGEVPVVAVAVSDAATNSGVQPNYRFQLAVHGVYRVDGGTVAYWSVRGLPSYEGEPSDVQWFSNRRGTFSNVTDGNGISETTIAVPERGELYTTLLDEDSQTCLCTGQLRLDRENGQEWQMVYATFAELPEDTTEVSMNLDGFGTVVHGIPVTDGPPPGQLVEEETVLTGEGWPTPPPAADIARAAETRTGGPIWVLAERGGATDGSWTETASGEEQTIDISSDVLFEFDKAEITAGADAALDQVAAEITESGVSKATVIGHTDSESDEAYNQDLSERRAQAVEAELATRLPDVALTVEGRGETEPVASNGTEEGRALNRRVTVSFSAEGEGR